MFVQKSYKYLLILALFAFPSVALADQLVVQKINEMVQKSAELSIPTHVLDTPEKLGRLIREHYLFSRENPHLLVRVARQANVHPSLRKELIRNFAEEMGSLDDGISHSEIYHKGLAESGIVVSSHTTSPVIESYINKSLRYLTNKPSSYIAGFFYANEAYAIPELKYIQNSILAYLSIRKEEPSHGLNYFFHMHLNGVEDSHRDEIGQLFEQLIKTEKDYEQLLRGAKDAIVVFETWWKDVHFVSCNELILKEMGI